MNGTKSALHEGLSPASPDRFSKVCVASADTKGGGETTGVKEKPIDDRAIKGLAVSGQCV